MDYPVLDKIPIFPLIKNFRANTVFNAFILAGIFQTILLSLILSTQKILDKSKMSDFLKWFSSIMYIFLITIVSYTIMYLVFGFGGGMLSNNK